MTDDELRWKVKNRHLLHDAAPWVRLFREEVELPTGTTIDDFYHLELPDFVVVIAITPDDQFVMVRGYKHGVGRSSLSPATGMIDENETPLDAAKRELLEETGYTAKDWNKLGDYVVDGNRHCGTMHLFNCRDVVEVQAPVEDETETFTVEIMNADQLASALWQGEIASLPSAMGVGVALLLKNSNPSS